MAEQAASRPQPRPRTWPGGLTGPSIPPIVPVALLTTLFVAPLLIAATVTNEPTPAFWAVLVLDLVALFVFAVVTISRPALFIGVLILWFALQRLVVALVAPHVDADTVRLLLTYKEGFYFILPAAAAVALYLRWRRGERALTPLLAADVVAVTWLGLLALHFLAAGDPSTPELTYARRFAAPVLLYVGGRLLVPSIGQLSSSLRLLAAVAVGVAAFGLIERFVFGVGFWADTIDATTFYGRQMESGLLPENWTIIYRGVPDGIFIALPLGEPVRRLVSSYMEPTTLGSFLAFALLLLLLAPGLGSETRPQGWYRRIIPAAVCLLAFALFATLSRGGMMTVLVGGALFVAVRAIQARGWPSGLPVVLGTAVAVVMSVGVVITTFDSFPGDSFARDALATRVVSGLSDEPEVSGATPPDTGSEPQPGGLEEVLVHPPGSTAEGASKHLDGLRSGLDRMLEEPLGAGLGAAGNWSDAPEAGGESTVGVVAAQLGIAGLVLYVAFFGLAVTSLVAVAWRKAGPLSDVALVLTGALLGLFLVSFVSESASGLLGNAPYFIFAGWLLATTLPAVERVRLGALPRHASTGDGGELSPLDAPPPSGDTISR